VCKLLLQAFPFPSTLGEVTLHPRSQACMFIYSSRGKWVFPLLLWSFPPTTAFTSFPDPDCWARVAAPASQCVCLQLTREVGLSPSPVEFFSLCHSHKLSHSWLLNMCPCSCPLRPDRLVYLQFREGFPSPLFGAQCAPPSLLCVFIVLIAHYSDFLFSLGGVRSVRGLCCSGPGLSVEVLRTT
jgi:hypothetical protein